MAHRLSDRPVTGIAVEVGFELFTEAPPKPTRLESERLGHLSISARSASSRLPEAPSLLLALLDLVDCAQQGVKKFDAVRPTLLEIQFESSPYDGLNGFRAALYEPVCSQNLSASI